MQLCHFNSHRSSPWRSRVQRPLLQRPKMVSAVPENARDLVRLTPEAEEQWREWENQRWKGWIWLALATLAFLFCVW
ncbi:hypothetical protein WJX72_004458 [[Myrmecia] bisecta]|uniref:Uncharacterized protein n=1 Tax=[Myrmecia] bisecta TaxID=41462 RepID=A0AAW1QQX5_9CHLO